MARERTVSGRTVYLVGNEEPHPALAGFRGWSPQEVALALLYYALDLEAAIAFGLHIEAQEARERREEGDLALRLRCTAGTAARAPMGPRARCRDDALLGVVVRKQHPRPGAPAPRQESGASDSAGVSSGAGRHRIEGGSMTGLALRPLPGWLRRIGGAGDAGFVGGAIALDRDPRGQRPGVSLGCGGPAGFSTRSDPDQHLRLFGGHPSVYTRASWARQKKRPDRLDARGICIYIRTMNNNDSAGVKPMIKLDTYAGSRVQQAWYRLRDLDTGHTPVALYKAQLQRSLKDIEEALGHLDAKAAEIAAGQEQLMRERLARCADAEEA